MNTEPSLALGAALTGIAQAVFLLLRAAGVDATKDLEGGVVALISALLMLPLITSFLIRFFVFPPAAVDKIEDAAFHEGFVAGSPSL